jgi:hypothetical protein
MIEVYLNAHESLSRLDVGVRAHHQPATLPDVPLL